jgi:hypothetical protein
MGFVLFFLGKIVIYTLWCWYGIRLLAPSRRESAPVIALGLAVLRIVAGLILGFTWGYMVRYVAPNEELSRLGFDPFTFLSGFLILRFIQWSGIAWLIQLGTGQSPLWIRGTDWLWRLGGVGISCAGDVFGLILYLGFVGIVC